MTASDERMRESERAWRASGAVEDEAAWLGHRRRAGQLEDPALVVAARLGHEAARRVLGLAEPDAPADVDPLSLLLGLEQEPIERAATVATIVVAWVDQVVPLWRKDGLDDAPARSVVEAARRCLRCPCADHVAEIEVTQAVLEEAWVSRSTRPASLVWGRARHLVHAAAGLSIDAASLHAGDAARRPFTKNSTDSWSSSAERLLGAAQRRDVAREAIVPRLLGYPSAAEHPVTGEFVVPARPPLEAGLAGLRGDLRWAHEYLVTARTLSASDPARAEEELGYLQGSLRAATAGLERLRALLAAWEALRAREASTSTRACRRAAGRCAGLSDQHQSEAGPDDDRPARPRRS